MSGNQMNEMRRTASAQMQKNFNSLYTKNPLPINDARIATAQFMVDESYINLWNDKLNKWEFSGGDVLSARQRRIFLAHLNAQYAKLITQVLDPMSRVFVRSYTEGVRGIPWHFPKCLLWNFDFHGASQGIYSCIDGVPRSGKTSFACLLMPLFNDLGIKVITNIAIRRPPDYIYVRKSLSEVILLMDRLDKWVLILDETATFVDKKKALANANIDFETLARFIGKMGGRLMMITHDFDKDIPTRLQEWITERYHKIEKDKVRIMLSGPKFKFYEYAKLVPDCDLKFITQDITSLKFDRSIQDILQKVQLGMTIPEALKIDNKLPELTEKQKEVFNMEQDFKGDRRRPQLWKAEKLGISTSNYKIRLLAIRKKGYKV